MTKGIVFAVLIAVSVLAAGLFGALHNQLSFSVGATYFLDFRFAQFAVDPELHNRWGAALVGWRASWWMGLFIGLPAFVIGMFMMARPQAYLAGGLAAVFAAVMVTLLASMTGLFLGMTLTDSPLLASIPLPDGITDRTGFLRAGLMHDLSYFGGLIGLVLAIMIMIRAARRERTYLNARKQP